MAGETDGEMEYTRLGSTGLEVSRLCLGTLNFGSGQPWMMNDREASVELARSALDAGVNFLDITRTRSVLVNCRT